MYLKLFLLTLKGLRYRPMRSWLTILGIVIGIMLVVVILALGDGLQGAIKKNLQAFGSDLIVIFPGKETNPFVGLLGGQKFKLKDITDLETIPGVNYVIPAENVVSIGEFKGEKQTMLLHATPWKGFREFLEESEGAQLTEGEWPADDVSRDVVLGSRAANELFKTPVRVGDEIVVKSKRLRVKGIIGAMGEQTHDNAIFLSLDVLFDITGSARMVRNASVKVLPGADIELIARQIRFQLSGQETVQDFTVLTPGKATRLIGDVLLIVELFLVIMALMSLIVGAVGIMNTMFTSVLERTKQIGIMKAVGASSDTILSLFLIESGFIGLIGGLSGIVFGLFVAFLIGWLTPQFGVSGLFSFASVDYYGLLAVLIVTFITGVVAGILPARRASRMEPAEALRYE